MTVSQQQNTQDPGLTAQKILEGEAFFNAGDTEQAICAFRDVLAIDPGNAIAHSNLGVVYWQSGDSGQALIHLKAAYEAEPENSTVVQNLAEVYAATGQRDEVTRVCCAYLDRHPACAGIRNLLQQLTGDANSGCPATGNDLGAQLLDQAQALLSCGETGKSVTVLQAALALPNPDTVRFRVHRLLGDIHRQAGDTGKAIHHLMEAFRIDSHNRDTVLELARLLHGSQRYNTAEHVLAAYIYLHPDDKEAAELLQSSTGTREATARPAAAPPSVDPKTMHRQAQVSLVERIPEINDILRVLLQLGVEINSILDVGILHGTQALMRSFPDLKHYLFEPVDDHFETIRSNYAAFDFELHHVALSNSDGEAWQNGICIDGSGRITHSKLSDEPLTKQQEPRLISTRPVRKARLDSLVPGLQAASPWLLKIDVDGHEIPILEGAGETLKNASVVVIEATRRTLLDRARVLADHGFVLYDIVDFAYYAGVLSQVDLVFLRKDIVDGNDDLRPIETRPFRRDQWYPLSSRRFGK